MASVSENSAKKRKKRTRTDLVRIAVCCVVIGIFLSTLVSQQIRIINIRRERAVCEDEIALLEKEYEELSEKAEYSSSDDFYEQKARDEGYVREDETVFIVGN